MKPWREELLQVLKESEEQYVKGEKLAEVFGFSRAALWKKISILRAEGYMIEAVTNRGYRMASKEREFESLLREKLTANHQDGVFDLYVADTAPSTNLLAREAGARGNKEIGVFAALRQTKGRGRRGRDWISDTDEGLWFSLLLRPDVGPYLTSSITLLFGLCILKALQRICTVPIGIKWPNDIISLQNGKKLCGILSETSMEENRISYAVVGCGINVLQKSFPQEIQSVATSLLLEGAAVSKAELLLAILEETNVRYPDYVKDPVHFIAEYRANCATLGRRVIIESKTRQEGFALDISDMGDLLVQMDDKTIVTCTSGEVSVRGMLGY